MITIGAFFMAISGLVQPLSTAISTMEQQAAPEPSMETTYYILRDGMYEEAILSQVPEFLGGDEAMELLLQLNIRYPDAAREQKIGGTVRVSVVINEEGQMEDAFIHEGIGGGCNDEALRAVKLLGKTGFEPGRLKGKAVTVKFDIPITFRPE
ncbi:MAG TPA: energy transducer TonB [Saprospiraceae bacterium]|nr:energy transducer TonB [Saprospiraceae bacterium]